MTTLHLIILGIVQGITEFLPISSSGHLILVPHVLGEADQGLLIDLGAHAGTLLAVMLLFYREVGRMILGGWDVVRLRKTENSKLLTYLFLGTLPAGIIGLIAERYQEEYLRFPEIIIFTAVFWGAVLWWVDRRSKGDLDVSKDMGLKRVMFIGCAQVLALIPGTSRSGITMTAARYLGFDRVGAARFSFLLSIPITAAAVLLGVYELCTGDATVDDIRGFVIAALVAFVTALVAVVFLLKWLKRFDFTPFVIYRFILAGVLVWWFVIRDGAAFP